MPIFNWGARPQQHVAGGVFWTPTPTIAAAGGVTGIGALTAPALGAPTLLAFGSVGAPQVAGGPGGVGQVVTPSVPLRRFRRAVRGTGALTAPALAAPELEGHGYVLPPRPVVARGALFAPALRPAAVVAFGDVDNLVQARLDEPEILELASV